MNFGLGFGIGSRFPTGSGEVTPPSTGRLEIDTFPVLIDTFEIIFS